MSGENSDIILFVVVLLLQANNVVYFIDFGAVDTFFSSRENCGAIKRFLCELILITGINLCA